MEEWKDIEGFENKYQVSTEGNVRSLNYNNTGKIRNLKPKVNRYGYLEVKLSKNNKTRVFLISTLVAKAFIKKPNEEMMACHISENILDNNVRNLKWCYRSEMLHNTYKRGRRAGTPSNNKISYKGISGKNKTDLFKKLGKKPESVIHRLNKGWTLEEAIEIPMNVIPSGPHRMYNYKNKYLTIGQIEKLTGVSANLIRRRLYKGWSIEEAVDIPNLRKGK